jgi:2-polyprenyl-6-hydroxyphenyl methylase / 3-demethylubiquinone-9 3-methyltransferase
MGNGGDPAELERFAALADRWWDETGPLAPLHKLNPVRLAYIRDRICLRLGRDPLAEQPLAGLYALDVGCGGGLLCEPLARLGATVTGIDLTPESIDVAGRHARAAGLAIDYRVAAAAELVAERRRFDLVCAMEVVEHVADQEGFLQACAALVAPRGGMVLATLNRTFRAFALGIVAAEYVLGWLPRGTHRWQRFMRPSEAARSLRRAGLRTLDLTGVTYDPLRDRFALSRDPAVNYMLFATHD